METLSGVHHFYGGMGMALLGYLIIALCRGRWLTGFGLFVVIAGALIMLDDIWQHSVQYKRQGSYASPCKQVYHYVSPRCPAVKEAVAWADTLFRLPVKRGREQEQ